ncbi:MAG: molybdopterin synthase [Halanaeroarchaeum sp.]
MHVLGIATGETDPDRLLTPIRDRLATRGSLAVIRRSDDDSVSIVADGWQAQGESIELRDALDRVARDHDYCLVGGVPDGRFPQVTDGTSPVDEPALVVEPGSIDLDAVIDVIESADHYETLGSLVARVKESNREPYAGAIATFTGRVRAKESEDDTPTTSLTFEKYEGVAEERMRDIEADLEAREGIEKVIMHHRVGRINAGEDIVFVVVLAGHRREAFAAVEDGIDTLKDDVPIFKKEVTTEEAFWKHDAA